MTENKSYTDLIEENEVFSINESELRIFDCRFDLSDKDYGFIAYLKSHIHGSDYISVDKHLSAKPGTSGRHPLPELETWIETIQKFGIENSNQIVLYDDSGSCYATRAWWMFRWAGHKNVAVLNGGWNAWNGPISSGTKTSPQRSDFQIKPALTKLMTMKELKTPQSHQLIDARSHDRWSGKHEPIDHTAGHIPKSLCFPFTDNLDIDKKFKSKDALAAQFKGLNSPVVCYCGSGITATHNIMAIKLAGLAEPYLYAGSWSEWIEHKNNPIAENGDV